MFENIKLAIKARPAFYRTLNRLRGLRLHDPDVLCTTRLLGSEYGAWAVDLTGLKSSSIVYSVGVGEDISFDLAMITTVGCKIFALDPTPIAIEWITRQNLPAEFNFIPIGLAAEDGDCEFHIPPIPGWHSFSVSPDPDARQSGTTLCRVMRLYSIMEYLGHEHVNLLKMDIEGFEYEVIKDIVKSKIRPDWLLIEYHHGSYGVSRSDTIKSVDLLRKYGYDVYWVSDLGREYGFKNRYLHSS